MQTTITISEGAFAVSTREAIDPAEVKLLEAMTLRELYHVAYIRGIRRAKDDAQMPMQES